MTPPFELEQKRYADLIVHIGLNLQPGQRLVVLAPLPAAETVHRIAASAYQAGCRLVDVIWNDDELTLTRFQNARPDTFEEFPVWQARALEDYIQAGDALLSIKVEDPDLLKGQDPDLVSTARNAKWKYYRPVTELTSRNASNWCVVGVPIPAWAAKVFPGLPVEAQIEKLWQAIYAVCRLDQDDPLAAWQEHVRQLVARSRYLTEKGYSALKYSSPVTDLTVGLPPGHRWVSAQMTSENGIPFIANLPTEEVFSIVDKNRVEGTVRSSRPLSYANTLIEDFTLTIEGGRVVKAEAAKGGEVLERLLDSDEGARRLGEVALVPFSSPISRSGILFNNTLFDENAASHLALGYALRVNLKGGAEMSAEEFAAAGGNQSQVHVDFMVGSAEMDVDGLRADGHSEPVMRDGEWAFEV